MNKEHRMKVGIFLGTVMFALASHLAVWGADALPPRTVLLVSADTSAEVPAAVEEEVPETGAAVEYTSCDCGEEVYFCAPPLSRVKFGGWLETGIYANAHGNKSKFDADGFIPTSGNSDRVGKLRSTGWQAQQLWVFAERELLNDGYGFDWGFRVDGMFGTDGYALQSWGDGSFDGNWRPGSEYGAAIPQMYLELGLNAWSLKLGKFFSPLGYEDITAPNFDMYSHSYLYEHTPATHTGALLTYKWDDCLSFYGGLTTGADTGWGNKYGDIGLLFGFEAQLTDKVSLSYGFMWNEAHIKSGREYSPGMWDGNQQFGSSIADGTNTKETLHSLVLEWSITHRLTYALEADYGNVRWDGATGYEMFGLANYLKYQVTCNLAATLRAEWFRQNSFADGRQNCYSYTFGFNYTPCEWLAIRPEIRYDLVHGENNNVFNNGRDNTQLMGGVGVILSF